MKNKMAGVILAAGYSSRMGSFKPLLPIGGRTAMEVLIDTFNASGVPEVYVVTGFNREALRDLIEGKSAVEIVNHHFDEGMFSSIQAGIRALSSTEGGNPDGIFLGLVDCPLITKETMKLLLEKAEAQCEEKDEGSRENFIIPCYQGKKGHPIYIPKEYFQEILDYKGPMGLKGFMSQYRDYMEYVETKDEAVVVDMDDKVGYEEVLNLYSREKTASPKEERGQETLRRLLGSKRLLLVRHCEQIQTGQKIFLGQTDFPLSREGEIRGKEIGGNLLGCAIKASTIYTSDLKRARQTACFIKDTLAKMNPEMMLEIIEKKEFREINLGSWDGKAIREIQEKFPEEYVERGRNLLGYKVDLSSENFYDLQYRVMKELNKIIMETVDEDIIIVTHAGVINVIISNFNNIPLEEQLKVKMERGSICVMENREG